MLKNIMKTISFNKLKNVGIKIQAKTVKSVLKFELEKCYLIDCANSEDICMK